MLIFRQKIKKSIRKHRDYNFVDISVTKKIINLVDELIDLYRNYDIEPPTSEEVRKAKFGDKEFLFGLEKNHFITEETMWKFNSNWKKKNRD